VRILLAGDYPPDPRLGSTKVLVKLQQEFRALGHDCDVMLADRLASHPRNGYARQALGPVAAAHSIHRAIERGGPYDVVDVASAEGCWVAALPRRTIGGAVVISRSNGLEHLNYHRMLEDHDEGLLHKPWTRRWFHPAFRLTQVAAAARHADRLLLLNDGDRDFALARGWQPRDRIDVVAHGVSSEFLSSAPPADSRRGRGVLFCGSWTGVKGVSYLVDAFERLLAVRSDARLTILGGGIPDADIASGFSVPARAAVTIVPRSPEPVVIEAYRTHDLLVWPSTYEGFGMVVVEAMSQRLPVVATPVGCAPGLIAHEESGLLVPRRDAAALAASLDRMLGDSSLRRRCAAAAFERVRGMTWTNTARETLAVYTRALDAREAA